MIADWANLCCHGAGDPGPSFASAADSAASIAAGFQESRAKRRAVSVCPLFKAKDVSCRNASFQSPHEERVTQRHNRDSESAGSQTNANWPA